VCATAAPRDLSVIGYDDVADAATSEPPLTTIRQPIAEKAASPRA
jgi:DNA-binding LacI/PurR family transcriptional regulator